ncbi:MAG: hypothetical protein A3H69_00630 [Candidatus Sungbacteria bacterium RIFCSPLOWO2_02_FULL_47_9]|uniref:Lipoprotein n=1 Tax=Candidatus Sungbacteria bacterium RIFCSPHIGHO2_01_FULL_47_32 TaxID=1802264 RepID=A0A1G2K4C9_9BACT|nr:MAG: hypothetical protein UX72_C0001G0045 [Parcubacteria group bacterium GW2011_GWA2_47_10]OGZ94267.1 MAG: hypothetical protein A2633_05655 [Candidatus Sungbacteria bacterium RIFCSPHIGHO2_01_FULL_47_32]OGZ99736.1 MAG: hypothetical protein A3D57_02445 [Candidatus Sungbacteria bacterium RIFCSPHIGHO2_02_FULL_46_12]OHA05908.1 MAG: hypothetical protein A3A28_02785 [Candidatus Sungbacteria bacterium RIFCSPLOWO2_01_FULL_47_32]OHA09671.1 MAG: hypothetical protein A3H69_00630 [Candidatus Sungbacteria
MLKKALAFAFCLTILAGCGTIELTVRKDRSRHQSPCYEITHIYSYQPTLWGKPVGEPKVDITIQGGYIFRNANPRFIFREYMRYSGGGYPIYREYYCTGGVPVH